MVHVSCNLNQKNDEWFWVGDFNCQINANIYVSGYKNYIGIVLGDSVSAQEINDSLCVYSEGELDLTVNKKIMDKPTKEELENNKQLNKE